MAKPEIHKDPKNVGAYKGANVVGSRIGQRKPAKGTKKK